MTKEQFYFNAKFIAGKSIADDMLEEIEWWVANENNGKWDEGVAQQQIHELNEEFMYYSRLERIEDCGY